MPKLNENYQNVKDSYLFAEIARRVKVYEETHPEKAADIIRLGIGDVTLPLTKSVIKALHEAVDSQDIQRIRTGAGICICTGSNRRLLRTQWRRSKSYRYLYFRWRKE